MSRLTEVRGEVEAWIDHLNQYSEITERKVRRLRDPAYAGGFARTLLAGERARLGGHEFCIANLRELNGREFPAVMAVNKRIRCSRNLRVFAGHRFTAAVTRNLRHNLQIVLRPYGIKAVYSDSDMPNGPVFETILNRIRAADFSIFDDRETEVRPNVLIELGAAIGRSRSQRPAISPACSTFRTPPTVDSLSISRAGCPHSSWIVRWRNRASSRRAIAGTP